MTKKFFSLTEKVKEKH